MSFHADRLIWWRSEDHLASSPRRAAQVFPWGSALYACLIPYLGSGAPCPGTSLAAGVTELRSVPPRQRLSGQVVQLTEELTVDWAPEVLAWARWTLLTAIP